MPFFNASDLAKKLPVLPACGQCKADRGCQHPKQTWPGKPANVVFVVDKLPDEGWDVENAIPKAQFGALDSLCRRVGVTLSAYPKVLSAACPGASKESWKHCQPLVASELERLKPTVIIPYGPRATQSVIGRYWKTPAELYDRWYGYQIPCRELNAWICPVGVLSEFKKTSNVSDIWEYRWLQSAMKLESVGRPWPDGSIDVKSIVRDIYTQAEIRDALQKASRARVAAFDYESTGLKPEWDNQLLVSMSVAWIDGDKIECVAFPVYRDSYDDIRGFLTSDVKKVAANMKFEDRWSRVKLGVQVRKWFWDTMQAAHWENPNSGITGLKFQAFARLGVPYFAGDVESFFESPSNRERNKILSLPIRTLLTYNGIDSVVELLLASVQMVDNGVIKEHFVPSKYLPRGA
jgi:hypothetical protein